MEDDRRNGKIRMSQTSPTGNQNFHQQMFNYQSGDFIGRSWPVLLGSACFIAITTHSSSLMLVNRLLMLHDVMLVEVFYFKMLLVCLKKAYSLTAESCLHINVQYMDVVSCGSNCRPM